MKNFNFSSNYNFKGFTLIEMMMVLVIVGILAGLIAVGSFKVIEEAKEDKARSAIAALETALEMYKTDVGDYPIAGAGDNSFVTWLESGSGQPATWDGPYMNFKDDEISASSYEDPWGNAYQYQCPGTAHGATTNPFDIWDGSGKSINSWDV